MVEEVTGGELQKLIEIGWRRKWVILVPFLIIFFLATIWALYKPSLYRSSTSIFVEAQKVPTDIVRSTVTTDIESRIRSIKQQLTSRTKLLKVIKQLDLYPDLVKKGVPSEVLVAAMRKDLEVEIPNSRDVNFFMVHYNHRDPTKAMLGVSNLVSLFVEESLQVRENQAEGTTKFIEDELAKLKKTLEKQEQAVQEYKRKYMGQLPDQLNANLKMLDNLQLQIASNQESQRELDGRVMLIEQEISRLEGQLDVAASIASEEGSAPITNATLNQLMAQRDALRQRIANMEAMYTDRHPDLVAARSELARVEDTLRSVTRELAKTESSSETSGSRPSVSSSMELTNLRRQLTEVKPRLASLRQEEKNLRGKIASYQKRVEAAPVREQQLAQLTRDYENTKANYEDLLNKKMEAQMSENLEKRQQGEKFQILDPANFPEKPFLPNRPKLMAMGFVGGLGSGIGLALLLEALFPAFYSLKQLQFQLPDIPIAFAVPQIYSKVERRKKQKRMVIVIASSIVATVVLLVLINAYVVNISSVFGVVNSNLKEML